MASNECYHFTKLKYLYSIRKNGLQPRLDTNSKAVGDTKPKISFSDTKRGAIGLFLEFYGVYNDYKNGNRVPDSNKIGETEMYDDIMNSQSLEDFLGEGVYLLFDGSEIENEGGNTGKGGIYDASTRTPIKASDLRVGLLRNDDTKHVSYSMYDYINYLIANFSDEERLKLPQKMQKNMIEYVKEHIDEISKFKNGNFSLREIDINTFCEICKSDINKTIEEQSLTGEAK